MYDIDKIIQEELNNECTSSSIGQQRRKEKLICTNSKLLFLIARTVSLGPGLSMTRGRKNQMSWSNY
jgi:hypothetical protein